MFRIAHFADFHLTGVNQDFDRALALIAHALGPGVRADHVVIAGDIVDLPSENVVTAFMRGLKGMGLSGPSKLTVVPGNHDIFPFSKRKPVVKPSRPGSNWHKFCEAVKSSRRGKGCRQLLPLEPYPVGKVLNDEVVLAALDSTRNRKYNPRGWASGELEEDHVDAVTDFFDRHADKQHKVIVMHHNPWEEESESWLFPMIMAEPDPDTACEWLAGTGASWLLCGHYHIVEQEFEFGDGSLQGFCAGTAGGVDDPDDIRRYHVLKLGKNGLDAIEDHSFDAEEVDEMIGG